MSKKAEVGGKPQKEIAPGKTKKEREIEEQSHDGKDKHGKGIKLEDPCLKRSFKGHKDAVLATCFNPNLKQVISGSLDGTVMVWNFKPNVRPYRFVGHRGAVYSVCINPAGNTIVSGAADDTIRIWNNTVEGYS